MPGAPWGSAACSRRSLGPSAWIWTRGARPSRSLSLRISIERSPSGAEERGAEPRSAPGVVRLDGALRVRARRRSGGRAGARGARGVLRRAGPAAAARAVARGRPAPDLRISPVLRRAAAGGAGRALGGGHAVADDAGAARRADRRGAARARAGAPGSSRRGAPGGAAGAVERAGDRGGSARPRSGGDALRSGWVLEES